MTDFSGIPRPFDPRQAKRRQEEEARRREQATSARNTSSTTVGAGGRLDIDGGDFSVFNGGNAVVRDGGRFQVQDGGSMDITDDGQVNVIGQGQELLSQNPVEVRASLANRDHFNSWVQRTIKQPGLYLGLNASRGDRDPRVVSNDGLQIETASAVEPLLYGPQVGPNMVSESGLTLAPGQATLGTDTWDDAVNPGGGGGLAGHKGYATLSLRPHDLILWLGNQTGGTPAIPDGLAVGISGTLEDGVLQLYGRNGVNVTGTSFTVGGVGVSLVNHTHPASAVVSGNFDWARMPLAPLLPTTAHDLNSYVTFSVLHQNTNGGAAAGANYPTATAGLLEVFNNPTSTFIYQRYSAYASSPSVSASVFTRGRYNGVWGPWAQQADRTLATAAVDGLMPKADKAKLDAATPNATVSALMQRDSSGRAKVVAPAVAEDIANKGYADGLTERFQLVPGTSLPATVTSAWSNLSSNVTVPADLFGAGVAYKISVFGQVQANPTSGLIISLRAVFNGTTPPGAKVNGAPGPNNASVQVVGDFLVTTSQAVTVNCQASAPFGGVPRGSGDDAPFFTITVTPYLAL